MTQKERRDNYYNKWLRSFCNSVTDYYNKPSETKISIEKSIKRTMIDLNGRRYRVLGGNNNSFTCGYIYPKEGCWYLVIEACSNHTEYKLTEEESLYAQ